LMSIFEFMNFNVQRLVTVYFDLDSAAVQVRAQALDQCA